MNPPIWVDEAVVWNRAALIVVAASILAGCSGVPIPPTSTDDELRAICERHSGWWRGGYCEYDSHL